MAADDDGEVFEITDFTTASEWERFISRIEEILHEWKLVSCTPKQPAPQGAYAQGVWEEKVEELNYASYKFCLTHVRLKSKDDKTEKSAEKESGDDEEDEEKEVTPTVFGDLMNMQNDFPSRAHCICRWFGLQDFVILSLAGNNEAVISESKTKLLLSSVSIALSDAGCAVPVFVQVLQRWRRLYHGTCILPGAAVEFGMVHLKRNPPQYSHLAGLLDVFKSKMGTMTDPQPVSVAVRFLYVLYDWVNSPWSQPLPDFDDEVGCPGFDQLPFGACEDPVSALHLNCTWPCLSEDMIVENQVYSDLDPLQAPQWSVRIEMTSDPQCLMGEYLINFLSLCHRKETLEQLVGNFSTDTTEAGEITTALQRLTEPSMGYNLPSLTSYVSQGQKVKGKPKETRDVPIQGALLDQILQFLFPDAAKSMTAEAEEENDEPVASTSTADSSATTSSQTVHSHIDLMKQLKSAPIDSLLHRLSVCLCVLNHNHGGLFAVAQVWQEFILEMRYRWENNFLIDGVSSGPPNLGSCLLQQKLQMLNCCIEHKKKREQLHKGYTGELDSPPASPYHGPSTSKVARSMSHESGQLNTPPAAEQSKPSSSTAVSRKSGSQSSRRLPGSDGSSDDDEFFECNDSENQTEEKEQDTVTDNQSVSIQDGRQGDNQATTGNQSSSYNQSNERGNTNSVMSNTEGNLTSHGREQETMEAEDNYRENQTHSDTEMECSTTAVDEEDSLTGSQVHDSDVSSQPRTSLTGSQTDNIALSGSQTRDSLSTMSVHSDSAVFKESYSHRPEGRLVPFQDLRLFNCDERMYIPITQEPAPMTEDMLEEHAEVLAKLGTSAEGAEQRARMQSACLLSDMESFKAANPGCVLEDFVRWYSPRDYIEEMVEDADGNIVSRGHLSLRMQIPGNMWVEVWQTARAVPARRQKRLFDDTKEAEKVLHYLSAMSPAEVVIHVLPMLVQAAVIKVMNNDDPEIPVLRQVIDQAVSKASQVTRSPKQDVKRYEEVIRILMQAEVIISRNISLRSKFTDDLLERPDAHHELDHFVSGILQNAEVSVRGGPMGPAGSVISKLFLAAQRASYMLLDDEDLPDSAEKETTQNTSVPNFPRPTAREYILRTMVPRPAPYSKILPQRMYCSIEEDEFRIAGSFTSDTVFQ